NWDQLEFRSADIQVRPVVDRDVWFVAPDILGFESLAEELLPEDIRSVKFSCELFLIVGSSVKLGMRVQSAEKGRTAAMVPVCVSYEHCRQWRQSWRIGPEGFVCSFCEVRSRARVDADELMAVLGNDEVVFREFEPGQRVNTTRHHLDDVS